MTYRGIGCFDKLFWLYFDNKVILWKDDSHNCKTNDMANKIRTIAVGRLTEVAVHFKKNSLVVMCVAIENEVWLYSVNLDTLKIDDLKLKYHLGNALAVEQILFIGMNRILMVGDTGAIQLAVFDDK